MTKPNIYNREGFEFGLAKLIFTYFLDSNEKFSHTFRFNSLYSHTWTQVR